VGVPGRIVGGADRDPLAHGHLPDPEGQAIDELAKRVAELEAVVRGMGVQKP